MTDEQKVNLVTAMNHDHFYDGKRCYITNVYFKGNQVIVEYSTKKYGVIPDHVRHFGSVD